MTIKNIKVSLVASALAVFLLPSLASAVVLNVSEDAFDDGVTTTNTAGLGGTTYTEVITASANGGTAVESGGVLTATPGGDNWARVEHSDNTQYTFPNATQNMVEFNWTVGKIDITTDRNETTDVDADDLRIQLNVNDPGVPASPSTGAERWLTDSGNISLDILFNETDANNNQAVYAQAYEKAAGAGVSTNGTALTNVISGGWDWGNDFATFTLTMDETGYTWSSDIAGSTPVVRTWAGSEFAGTAATEFATGMYVNTGTHNVDTGRGSSMYSNLTVGTMTVPEPASIAIVMMALSSLLAFRKRR